MFTYVNERMYTSVHAGVNCVNVYEGKQKPMCVNHNGYMWLT